MTLTIPFVNPRWRGAPTQRDNSSGAALKRGLAGVEKGTAIGCSRPGIAGMGPVHACHGGRADLDTYANAWLESEGKRMDDSMGKGWMIPWGKGNPVSAGPPVASASCQLGCLRWWPYQWESTGEELIHCLAREARDSEPCPGLRRGCVRFRFGICLGGRGCLEKLPPIWAFFFSDLLKRNLSKKNNN